MRLVVQDFGVLHLGCEWVMDDGELPRAVRSVSVFQESRAEGLGEGLLTQTLTSILEGSSGFRVRRI